MLSRLSCLYVWCVCVFFSFLDCFWTNFEVEGRWIEATRVKTKGGCEKSKSFFKKIIIRKIRKDRMISEMPKISSIWKIFLCNENSRWSSEAEILIAISQRYLTTFSKEKKRVKILVHLHSYLPFILFFLKLIPVRWKWSTVVRNSSREVIGGIGSVFRTSVIKNGIVRKKIAYPVIFRFLANHQTFAENWWELICRVERPTFPSSSLAIQVFLLKVHRRSDLEADVVSTFRFLNFEGKSFQFSWTRV